MSQRVIKDPAEVPGAIEELIHRPVLACDLETTGLDPHRDQILLVQFGDDRHQVAFDARALEDLSPLSAVLERDGLTVFHNAQFDLKFLKSVDLQVSRPQDTMLLEILIAGGRRTGARTLKACADRRVGLPLDKAERATFVGFAGTLTDSQITYALDDVLATWHLFVTQAREIEAADLGQVARIEGAATDAFAELEYRGIYLDRDAWEGAMSHAEAARDKARKDLEKALLPVVGGDLFGNVHVNLESEVEMREVFEKLGFSDLPDLTRRTLSRLDHPVASALVEWRKHQHALASYADRFVADIHPVTGRIHARFRQIKAATGRASCEDPPLQAVKKGDGFREAFKAPRGRKMVTADYAAAELRIIGQLTGDATFLAAFEAGEDLHAAVATGLFGKTVTKTEHPELRERAKAVSFGLAYGMGAGGLAAQLEVSSDEARSLLDKYFKKHPKIREYFEDSSRTALRRGYARTLAGRRQYLDETDDPEVRSQRERQAKNMPIQGTSADIVKLAMARAVRSLRRAELDAFLVNTVHDELVLETAEADAEAAGEVLRAEMVRAGETFLPDVPTVVDLNIDDHWAK